jgi:type IV secretory pathway VirB6-like protein
VKLLFHEEVLHSPSITNFTIILAASKTFIFMHLLYKDGDDSMEPFQDDKLNEMMDKFIKFCSFNIKNLVSSLKHCPNNENYLSNIMSFKYKIGYDYI